MKTGTMWFQSQGCWPSPKALPAATTYPGKVTSLWSTALQKPNQRPVPRQTLLKRVVFYPTAAETSFYNKLWRATYWTSGKQACWATNSPVKPLADALLACQGPPACMCSFPPVGFHEDAKKVADLVWPVPAGGRQPGQEQPLPGPASPLRPGCLPRQGACRKHLHPTSSAPTGSRAWAKRPERFCFAKLQLRVCQQRELLNGLSAGRGCERLSGRGVESRMTVQLLTQAAAWRPLWF